MVLKSQQRLLFYNMGNCQKSEDDIRASKVVPPRSELYIKCYTWKKDYQGLYDYESKDVQKEEITITTSGIAVKDKKQAPFSIIPMTHMTKEVAEASPQGIKFMVHRKPAQKGFLIENIKVNIKGDLFQKNVWIVVRNTPQKKHILKEGDVIKLGRQKFRVKEMIFKQMEEANEQDRSLVNTKRAIYGNLTKSHKAEESQLTEEQISQALCRVCLDPGCNTNPLISPCKCQGSMKYIHLECLRMWLAKRLEPSTRQHCVIINWKPLVCELCTAHFMYKVYLDQKKYYTVEIPRPEKPYIVLQILNKGSNQYKTYTLISFAGRQQLKLGRKHDTDVRISDDISVSRNHAVITLDQESLEFTLQDLNSKFGTLILAKKKLKIDENHPSTFQVGPNLFCIRMIRGLNQPQTATQEDSGDDNSQQSKEDAIDYQESEQQSGELHIQPQDLSPTLPQKSHLDNMNSIQLHSVRSAFPQNANQQPEQGSPQKKEESVAQNKPDVGVAEMKPQRKEEQVNNE